MRKMLFILLILYSICSASDFLFMFDLPDNKKLIPKLSIPFKKEIDKTIPPLSTVVPVPKGDNLSAINLEGVVKADNNLIAIINGNLYKVGDSFNEYKITEITINSVTFDKKGKKETIFIK
ncbi:MAG: hypothetical protein N3C60_08640 [Calditerrivibrio sp.]|nr:hypothetical protein [Calditerrivibrio sp.]